MAIVNLENGRIAIIAIIIVIIVIAIVNLEYGRRGSGGGVSENARNLGFLSNVSRGRCKIKKNKK